MFKTEKAQRIRILYVIAINIIVLLLIRLLWLQVIHGPEYKLFSEDNAVRKTIVPSARGIMYDRKGKVLWGIDPALQYQSCQLTIQIRQ